MPGAPDRARRIAHDAGVGHYLDAATLHAAERDFGGVAQGRCLLVAEPSNGEACSRLIAALARDELGCTLRGSGYGQSGQSVPLDTVSLSTRRLDQLGGLDLAARSITVGAGVSLRRVLAATREFGLAPPVLPLNLDMSIGGLLSAGGLGPTSHRHGPVAAHVLGLEVVTGDGRMLSCTRRENAELFHAVLGGVGQCGLITQATLELRPAPREMRVFSFLYGDSTAWLEDQLAASSLETELHIEGFCWMAAKGQRATENGPKLLRHWMYGLEVSVDETHAGGAPVKSLLAALRPVKQLDEHVTDLSSFLHRYEPRFSGMVQSGAWSGPHPWLELIVPLEHAEEVLLRALELLPVEAGDGHRFMLLDTAEAARSCVFPRGGRAALIGIFPVALGSASIFKMLSSAEQLTELAVQAGGGRYLSGFLGADGAAYFRSHLGERYRGWVDTRRRFDPGGTFRSSLFPDGNRG